MTSRRHQHQHQGRRANKTSAYRRTAYPRLRHLHPVHVLVAAVVGLAAFPALASGCHVASRSQATPTSSVDDDRGRPIAIPADARRIVSLVPSHTETLFALGAGDRLVGRDTNSDSPPAALSLPDVGALTPNIEAIAAIHPDLVLCGKYGEQAAILENAGFVTWASSPESYSDVFRSFERIGSLVRREAEARALTDSVARDVEAVGVRVRNLPVVSVYYEVDPTPYSVGPRSFVGVILEKAGGRTIVDASAGDFPRIAPEHVLLRDPEIIVGLSLDEAKRRPGWERLRAVVSGHVWKLSDTERNAIVRPGPNLARGVEAIARRIHPEAFR